jgi:hypothetical protein
MAQMTDLDSNPSDFTESGTQGISVLPQSILFNFAFDLKIEACVVNEIDLDGCVRCWAFKIIPAIDSFYLGEQIKQPIQYHVKIRRSDGCFPGGRYLGSGPYPRERIIVDGNPLSARGPG